MDHRHDRRSRDGRPERVGTTRRLSRRDPVRTAAGRGGRPVPGGVWLDDNSGRSTPVPRAVPAGRDERSGLRSPTAASPSSRTTTTTVVRRVLASARSESEASFDLTSWTTKIVAPEVTVEVPDGVDVDVTVTPCGSGSGMSGGGTQPDGTSEASVCQYGQRVKVVAPTVALAEVVAATILFPPEQRTYLEGWRTWGWTTSPSTCPRTGCSSSTRTAAPAPSWPTDRLTRIRARRRRW